MASLQQKINIMRKEFAEMDLNHDELLTQDELMIYLDKKSGKEFDRSVGIQLYERMDKDLDGRITVDEFIKVFLEAEEILVTKCENSKKYLEDHLRQRKEAYRLLEENRLHEQVNSYGIMDGSVLNVEVKEAKDIVGLDWDNSSDPYVILTCGANQAQTRVAAKNLNPVWKEQFNFHIETGMEDLHIVVMDHDQHSRDDFAGQITIPLNRLSDQLNHDEWFELFDNNGKRSKSRISLGLQWFHSKVKYLTEVVNKWDEHIKLQEEDLDDYEKDLAELYQPFPGIVSLYKRTNDNNQNLYFKNELPEGVDVAIDPSSKKVSNRLKDEKNIVYYSYILTASYLVVAIFAAFYRPCFLDLLIPSFFIMLYSQAGMNGNFLKFLAGGVIFSFLIDLPWLILFSKNWWEYKNDSQADPIPELYIKRFSIAMSYLLFFLKLLSLIVYYQLSLKLPNPETSTTNTFLSQIPQDALKASVKSGFNRGSSNISFY